MNADTRRSILLLGLVLAGCTRQPPTHLEQVQGSADGLELARACILDISDEIERLKPMHPELSGWRPARPGVRSLTYDYKGCRIWIDIRRASEQQPQPGPGPWATLGLPALALVVYCAVEAPPGLRKAAEAAVRRHVGALAEIDRRAAREHSRAQPRGDRR